jgi:hypothetical protein
MEYHDETDKTEPTMFNFYANADVEVGDELMISYGDYRSSYNFLLYCGFIPMVRPMQTFFFGATYCHVLL